MNEKPKRLTLDEWHEAEYAGMSGGYNEGEAFHANDPYIEWQEARIIELEDELRFRKTGKFETKKEEEKIMSIIEDGFNSVICELNAIYHKMRDE